MQVVAEHAVANGVLELIPVGGREMGGLVELHRALGILAEHAVDDTDVESLCLGLLIGIVPDVQGIRHGRDDHVLPCDPLPSWGNART